MPLVAWASPRQSPKPERKDSNGEGYPLSHFSKQHRSEKNTSPPTRLSSHSKEREQGKGDLPLPGIYSTPTEMDSDRSRDIPLAKPHEVPLTSADAYHPPIRHPKLAEILSSPSPAGRKDDLRSAPQKSAGHIFKTSRSGSDSAKLPPPSSSHLPASNASSTLNLQDPATSLQSLELASTRQPASGSLQNSPARGRTTNNTPPSGNPPRILSTTSHTPSPTPTTPSRLINTQNPHAHSHLTDVTISSQPNEAPSAVAGIPQSQPFTVSSLTSSEPDAGQGSHKVHPALTTHPSAISSNRGQAKAYNYPSLKTQRLDPSNTHTTPGHPNPILDLNKLDTYPSTSNAQSLSQTISLQPPVTRHQQYASLPAATAPSFAVAPSTRTHIDPIQRPTVTMRDSQSRKVDPHETPKASTSTRPPTAGSRTAWPSEKASRRPSEDSTLKTPSSLAPSVLKQTPSHTSIPASVSSQQDPRKRGLFGMFKVKAAQTQPQPQKFEIWHPPSGTQNTDKESRKANSLPTMPPNTDTKIVSSQANAPVAITVPITIAASGRRSPNSKVFTPFRYLTSKRNRNMSAASVEAQDGTAVRFDAYSKLTSSLLNISSQTPLWGLQLPLCIVNPQYKCLHNGIRYLLHRNGEGERQLKHEQGLAGK